MYVFSNRSSLVVLVVVGDSLGLDLVDYDYGGSVKSDSLDSLGSPIRVTISPDTYDKGVSDVYVSSVPYVPVEPPEPPYTPEFPYAPETSYRPSRYAPEPYYESNVPVVSFADVFVSRPSRKDIPFDFSLLPKRPHDKRKFRKQGKRTNEWGFGIAEINEIADMFSAANNIGLEPQNNVRHRRKRRR